LTELESGHLPTAATAAPPAPVAAPASPSDDDAITPSIRMMLERMAQSRGISPEFLLDEVRKIVAASETPTGLIGRIMQQLPEILSRARGPEGKP